MLATAAWSVSDVMREAENTWDGEARLCGHASTNLRQGLQIPNPYQVYEHAPQSVCKSQSSKEGIGFFSAYYGRELPSHASPLTTLLCF